MSVSKRVTIQTLGVLDYLVCINNACLMSMGGENTAASSFKSVEHVVEVKAKRRLFLVTPVTPISTLKMV